MKIRPVPQAATGCVGFAFGSVVTLIALAGADPGDLGFAVVAAVVVGLITAWAGEPFFDRLLRVLRWL